MLGLVKNIQVVSTNFKITNQVLQTLHLKHLLMIVLQQSVNLFRVIGDILNALLIFPLHFLLQHLVEALLLGVELSQEISHV